MCNLEKTEVILGMPWLAVYNPEINWETGEVKMMRCLSLYGGKSQKKEKVKRVATEEEEKIIRWAIDVRGQSCNRRHLKLMNRIWKLG